MTIERDYFNGPIAFNCDECGEVLETRCTNFGGAQAKLQAAGWKAVKRNDEWFHRCSDCAR